MSKYKPLHDKVLVKCKEAEVERKSASGLYLGGGAPPFVTAKVMAVSEGVAIEGTQDLRPPLVKAGDEVVLIALQGGGLPGLEVETGSPLRFVAEADLVAIIEGDE